MFSCAGRVWQGAHPARPSWQRIHWGGGSSTQPCSLFDFHCSPMGTRVCPRAGHTPRAVPGSCGWGTGISWGLRVEPHTAPGWDGEGLLCREHSLSIQSAPQQGQGPSPGTGPQPSEPHQAGAPILPVLGVTWRRGGGGRAGRASRGRVLTTASKFIFPVSQQQHCLIPILCGVRPFSPLCLSPGTLFLTVLSQFNQLCLSSSLAFKC